MIESEVEWNTYYDNDDMNEVRIFSDHEVAMDELMQHYKSNEPMRMLELGSGTGRALRWYKKMYFPHAELFGVDTFKHEKTRGYHFVQGDIRNVPFPEEFFDLVFSFGVIEHFKSEDRGVLLAEHRRVLKKGGTLILAFPNLRYDSPVFWWTKLIDDPRSKIKHQHTTVEDMVAVLKIMRFQILEQHYFGWVFSPHKIPRFSKGRWGARIGFIIGKKL